jgi:hypothetical protein
MTTNYFHPSYGTFHPSYGTPFIDESHGKDGFSYVGRPGTDRGFSGQAVTPRHEDSEDSEDSEDD